MKKFKLHLVNALKDAFNPENELKYFEFFSQFDNCLIKYSDSEVQILDTHEKILFRSTTESNGFQNDEISYILSLLETKNDGDYIITLNDGHKIVFGLPIRFVREISEKSGGITITFGSMDVNGFIVTYQGELPGN